MEAEAVIFCWLRFRFQWETAASASPWQLHKC